MKKRDEQRHVLKFMFAVMLNLFYLGFASSFMALGINFVYMFSGGTNLLFVLGVKIWSVMIMGWVMLPSMFAEYVQLMKFSQNNKLQGRKKR